MMDLHEKLMSSTTAHQSSCEPCEFLGALIGGAVSLIGGMSARKDAKKRDAAAAEAAKVPVVSEAETSHTLDLAGMVKASLANGFNPMAILGAGGLSAFTKSFSKTTTTGQNAMAAVPTAPSMGSVISGALSTGFNIYREDAAAAKAAATSYFPPAPSPGMARPLSAAGFAGLPAMSSSLGKASSGAGVLAANLPATWETGVAKVTNPNRVMKVDPSFSDAETSADRYGDIAEEIAGARNFIADTLYNATGETFQAREARVAREQQAARPYAGGLSTKSAAVAQSWAEYVYGGVSNSIRAMGRGAGGGYDPRVYPSLSKDSFADPMPQWAW